MTSKLSRTLTAGLLAAAALGGCAARASEGAGTNPAPDRGASAPADEAGTARRRPAHSAADALFMAGMIGHHAQAVRMAGWAATHGASPAVRRLADRIVVGQRDEIALMQRWLRDRGEPVPEPDTLPHGSGSDHSAHMAGMLAPEELDRLDRARGAEFDRLFLTFMIRHHEGALVMVDRLFASQGAAQDESVFRLASDVQADQTAEIDRMRRMLDALTLEGAGSR